MNKGIRHWGLIVIFGICSYSQSFSQEILTERELSSYQNQIRQIISFLEFSFNTVGSSQSTRREKNTIIDQSYLKVFRDDKVQIEDDLLADRTTIINKDVQAYLKDIDFFFNDAQFSFSLDNIEYSFNDDNQLYFTAELKRKLSATTRKGESVENEIPRYIDFNVNRANEALKIVSIYSTKISMTAAIQQWWNTLPLEWKEIFADSVYFRENFSMADALSVDKDLKIGDTLYVSRFDTIVGFRGEGLGDILANDAKTSNKDSVYLISVQDTVVFDSPRLMGDLQQVVDSRSLNISNRNIADLSPLWIFKRLQKLSLAYTPVKSLDPLKNLRRIEELNCNNTQIESLEAVKFLSRLRSLSVEYSLVHDLNPVSKLLQMEKLDLTGTLINDLGPIKDLKKMNFMECNQTLLKDLSPLSNMNMLKHLDISRTNVEELSPLSNLSSLEELRLTQTPIKDLQALAKLKNLQALYCEKTSISDLSPLIKLERLDKVYCDQSGIKEQEANRFMRSNPNVLVIHKSEGLLSWWNDISPAWKQFFQNNYSIPALPDREQLQRLANIKEINISRHTEFADLGPLRLLTNLKKIELNRTLITNLEPLRGLRHLEYISLSYTGIQDLTPLSQLNELTFINCEFTPVSSIHPLSELFSLEELWIDKTLVDDLLPLSELSSLRRIYCDQSRAQAENAEKLMALRPDLLIIYRTQQLAFWWEQLLPEWQKLFRNHINMDPIPSREQLHMVVSLASVFIEGNMEISSLEPLSTFSRLKELTISRTRISDLNPLKTLNQLERITLNESPVRDLKPLLVLNNLKYLDLSNTPISDIDELGKIKQLESLNCSGTKIKTLKPIGSHQFLKSLDFSNTFVKKISHIKNLKSLQALVCYNTRIPPSKVDKFKKANPGVEVVYY